MLHFLGGLNRKSQDPTSQPENVCYIFRVFDIFPPKNRSNMSKHVQTCPNIGIGIKHDIRIYQNDSECRMGMNGEDMVG